MWHKHPDWEWVVSFLAAFGSTLAPEPLRALCLMGAVGFACHATYNTFGKERLRRTAAFTAFYVAVGVGLYAGAHLVDEWRQSTNQIPSGVTPSPSTQGRPSIRFSCLPSTPKFEDGKALILWSLQTLGASAPAEIYTATSVPKASNGFRCDLTNISGYALDAFSLFGIARYRRDPITELPLPPEFWARRMDMEAPVPPLGDKETYRIYIRNKCQNFWVNLEDFSAKIHDGPVAVLQKEFQIPINIAPNKNNDALSCQSYQDVGDVPPLADFFFNNEASRFELQNLGTEPIFYWGYRWGDEPIDIKKNGARVVPPNRYAWPTTTEWVQMRLSKIQGDKMVYEPLEIYLRDKRDGEWVMTGTVASYVRDGKLSTSVTIHDLKRKKWSK